MSEEEKSEFNLISELVNIAKSLVKRIHEQWAAMASLLAILVTILILTFIKTKDQDGNEYQIFLITIVFFTVILLLGKDRQSQTEDNLEEIQKNQATDPEIAFHIYYHALEKDSLQYKILHFLDEKEATSLPELSQELQFSTAVIRKSADRLATKGFLEPLPGEKPKHINYKTTYKLPKKC